LSLEDLLDMKTMHAILPRVTSTTELLLDLARSNRHGHGVGLPSICSANRFVLEAAVHQAQRDDTVVLVESTCNQVNQFGGYTGLRPADFKALVADVAARQQYPPTGVILGGDHLGPFPWRAQPAAEAMAKARELVRAYVLAGYSKIHLDCSMRLADDQGAAGEPLSDETATARTVELAAVAEAAWGELPDGQPAPLYVIGTEVPVPGGEQAAQAGPAVTTVAHAQRTCALCERAFATAGLQSAWERVFALVVQPGVEFGDAVVFDYRRSPQALELSRAVERLPGLVYEAHSTDYQTSAALRSLVEDHFAVLKVGPALTFALREGLFALAAIEGELFGASPEGRAGVRPSHLRETVDRVMREQPEHWQAYYSGPDAALRVARDFSYSDRIRYYWPQAEVREAVERLIANLSAHAVPPALLGQHLPDEARAVRDGSLPAEPSPQALIRHKILTVLDDYATACGMRQA
jgi:D-tagatose-1,6-bisphosphate aldolase subunit GatZ/KbaZ